MSQERNGGFGTHMQNQGGRRGMTEAGAWPGEQEGHSPSSVMVTYLPQMHPH